MTPEAERVWSKAIYQFGWLVEELQAVDDPVFVVAMTDIIAKRLREWQPETERPN